MKSLTIIFRQKVIFLLLAFTSCGFPQDPPGASRDIKGSRTVAETDTKVSDEPYQDQVDRSNPQAEPATAQQELPQESSVNEEQIARIVEDWKHFFDAANEAIENGDSSKAESRLKASLEAVKPLGTQINGELRIVSLLSLASISKESDRLKEAGGYLQHARQIAEEKEIDPSISFALKVELGELFGLTEQFAKAEEVLLAALEILSNEPEVEIEHIFKALDFLSEAQIFQDKYMAAVETMESLLDLKSELELADVEFVARCLTNIAFALEQASESNAASERLVEAINIVRQNELPPELANHTYSVGLEIARSLGDSSAIELFRQELALLGTDAPGISHQTTPSSSQARRRQINTSTMQQQAAYEELIAAQQAFNEIEQDYNVQMYHYAAMRDLSTEYAGRTGAMGVYELSFEPPEVDQYLIGEREQARQRLIRAQQTFQRFK